MGAVIRTLVCLSLVAATHCSLVNAASADQAAEISKQARSASPAESALADDAAGHRGWISETAFTNPAGSWSITSRQVALIEANVSVTDWLELTAMTLTTNGTQGLYRFTAKAAVIRRPTASVAILSRSIAAGDFANETEWFAGGTLGAVGTACVDNRCRTIVSASAELAVFHHYLNAVTDDTGVGPILSASVVHRVTHGLSAVGEAHLLINRPAAYYGARLGGSRVAVDVGMAITGYDNLTFGVGLPMVSVTVRP